MDVDPGLAQGAEELGGHPRVGAHAGADQGELADVGVEVEALEAELAAGGLQGRAGAGGIAVGTGEGDVRQARALGGDVLDDHVDIGIRTGHDREDAGGGAGHVGDTDDGDLVLAAIVRDAGDDGSFHVILLGGTVGAGLGPGVDGVAVGGSDGGRGGRGRARGGDDAPGHGIHRGPGRGCVSRIIGVGSTGSAGSTSSATGAVGALCAFSAVGTAGTAPGEGGLGDDGRHEGALAAAVVDPGAGLVREGGAHVDRHSEAAGVLHGAQVKDLGAVGGHLEGLLAGERLDALGGRHDAGVSGEQAVDVGVDLAHVGVEGGGQRHSGRVRAAAAEGGGVLDLVDALESRDDGDRASLDGAGDALGQNADDRGAPVLGVGQDTRLGAGVGAGRDAELAHRHGEQGHRDALTGGQEDVHLTGGRLRGQGAGHVEELVGGVAHGGDDHDDGVAGLARGDDALGDASHRLNVADGRAAVLLHDQCHVALLGAGLQTTARRGGRPRRGPGAWSR